MQSLGVLKIVLGKGTYGKEKILGMVRRQKLSFIDPYALVKTCLPLLQASRQLPSQSLLSIILNSAFCNEFRIPN